MEIKISDTQRRASLAALSAPQRSETYAGVPSDPVTWLPEDNPFWEEGKLRKPAEKTIFQMAAAYVDYHYRSSFSPEAYKASRESLIQVVVDDWKDSVGPVREMESPDVFSMVAIDDLQTGYRPEQLPLWKTDPPTKRPWHWRPPNEVQSETQEFHPVVSFSDFEEFGDAYTESAQEISDCERLENLLEWTDGLHTITADHMVQPPLVRDIDAGCHIADWDLYESNYESLLKGGRTWYPDRVE